MAFLCSVDIRSESGELGASTSASPECGFDALLGFLTCRADILQLLLLVVNLWDSMKTAVLLTNGDYQLKDMGT